MHGPTPRSQLTAALGLNRSTIGDLTGELVAAGLLREEAGRADRPGAATPGITATVGPRAGLSELVVPGILVAIAIFLIVGTVNMKLPPSVQVPGSDLLPDDHHRPVVVDGPAVHRADPAEPGATAARRHGRDPSSDRIRRCRCPTPMSSTPTARSTWTATQVDEIPPDVATRPGALARQGVQ